MDDAQSLRITNDSTENIFAPIFAWSAPKVLGMTLYLLTETLGNTLLIGIIWYEKCGSDPSTRTLINKLTSAFCTMLLTMNLTLTNYVAYVHLTGPSGVRLCSLSIFCSNFFLCLGLLYLDTIIILRYMYIFWWKNVGAINDQAFSLFSTVNNIVIAFLIGIILYILGFNQNINYFICSGQDPRQPNLDAVWIKVSPLFSFDIFCLLPALSCAIHLFIFIKIYFYNRAENAKRKIQLNILNSPEQNRNISDLATSMLSMCLIFVSSIPMALIITYFKPTELGDSTWGQLCVFLAHFGIQFVTSIPLMLIYYARNDGLHSTVWRKLSRGFARLNCDPSSLEMSEKLRRFQILRSRGDPSQEEDIPLEQL